VGGIREDKFGKFEGRAHTWQRKKNSTSIYEGRRTEEKEGERT